MRPRPPYPSWLLPVVAVLWAAPSGAQFVDRTVEAGLSSHQLTWGAAFADLDGDGTLDLYAGHHYALPVIFWNNGLGEFDNRFHQPPWGGGADRHGVLLVSADADADLEIFITHGADGGNGAEPSELYRNDGGGGLWSLLGAGGMSDATGRKRSASAADFDGDHKVDIYVAEAPDVTNRNSLFKGSANMTFVDVASAAGIAEAAGTVGGIWGDFDDDGDPDLLVGGEEFQRTTVLWRNDHGVFHDATAVFSPLPPIISGADWGDYDNDGDLDLAVVDGNLGLWDTYAEGDTLRYYFNTRFADTGLDGLTIPSTADTTWASFRIRAVYDTSKIFLGPLGTHPVRGTAAIALTDQYVGAPAFVPGVTRGTFVWRVSPGGPWEMRCSTPDRNLDTFDGFFTVAGAPITGVTPDSLEHPNFPPGGPRVWRNDDGHFVEVTADLGLTLMLNPHDVSWVDYDNDGDLDLHIVDMGTSAQPNAPDRLYRNDGPGRPFVDVTAVEGVQGGTQGMGDGGVWGDIDGDGDLDLFLQEGAGPLTFSAFGPSTLLLNKGSRGYALLLDFVGAPPGMNAIGTKVTAVAGTLRVPRRVQANSWRGFQDPYTVHLGLDTAAVADSVIVQWPDSVQQLFRNLPAGHWRIVENQPISGAPLVGRGFGPEWSLSQVAPQPATDSQRFTVDVPHAISLDVSVDDVTGRLVRTLHRGTLAAGRRELLWDGRDAGGHRVAAGVYWIRATDGRSQRAVKAVRLR
ncbi:MAG: FG-GAP-like repeat-containing protein [bacterium]